MTEQTYIERTTAAIEALEQALRSRFKAEGAPAIPYVYNGATYDIRDRETRMLVVAAITDGYYHRHAEYTQKRIDRWAEKGCGGERPATPTTDGALLDRLNDIILYDDFVDSNPNKAREAEYPVFSETQLARRREGKHQGKREGVVGREVAFGQSNSVGVDGRNYATPIRRERSDKENTFMDAGTKSRNRERQQAYDAFTKEQPVITYNLADLALECGEVA